MNQLLRPTISNNTHRIFKALILTVLFFSGVSVTAQPGWNAYGPSLYSSGTTHQVSMAYEFHTFQLNVAYRDDINSFGATAMRPSGGTWNVMGTSNVSASPAHDVQIEPIDQFASYLGYRDEGINRNGRVTIKMWSINTWFDVYTAPTPFYYHVQFKMTLSPSDGKLYFVNNSASNMEVRSIYGGTVTNIGNSGVIPFMHNPDIKVSVLDRYPVVAGTNNLTKDIEVYKFNGSTWNLVGTPIHSGWNHSYIDGEMQTSFSSLSIDNTGKIYIAYRDSANGDGITVRKFDGATWNLVGSANISGGSAVNPIIKAEDGIPYLAYQEGTAPNNWVVKRFYLGSWLGVGIGQPTSLGRAMSFVVASGVPTITFMETPGNKLTTKRYTCGSGPFVSVNSTADVICNGQSTTLTATGGVSRIWSNGDTTASITVSPNPNDTTTYYVTCYDANGCFNQGSRTVTIVYGPPVSNINSSTSTIICTGDSVRLMETIGISVTRQWKKDGVAIPGATTNSYYAKDAGNYTCVTTNVCGSTTSNTIAVTVNFNTPPIATISTSGSTSICAGTSKSLVANAGSDLTYQWQLNGINISGATASTYNASSAGDYTCFVSNNCELSTTSNIITITVIPLPTATITGGGPTTICNGGSVPLDANTGAGLSYQWRRNSSSISGATASSYSATLAGAYTCVVTSNGCSKTSNSITVVITSVAPPATITAAASTTICAGSSVTLNANTGTGLSHQWKLDGADLPGATAASYSAAIAGTYTCVVTNACGSTTSNGISVTTIPLPVASISAGGPTTLCPGSSVTFNANTGAGLTHQWQRDGINISGATTSSYVAMLAGNYSCIVTENGCSATSNSIAVTINGLLTYFIKPDGTAGKDAYLTNYSSDAITNFGVFPDFDALAWTVNSTPVTVRSLIEFNLNVIPANALVQSATLSLFNNPTSANNNGSHSSLSGSNAGWLQKVTAPWNENTVTWNTQPSTTTLNQVAVPQSTGAHQDYTIDITAMIQDMVTNPSTNYGLMISLQLENYYRALLFASSDHADPAKWPALTINYYSSGITSITAAGPTTFCSGGSVTLNATTGPGITYQWQRDGIDIPGATSSSYVATIAGNYTCLVTDACNTSASNALVVTISGSPPAAAITAGGSTNICSGSSVALNANTGTGLSYQWKLNGGNISGATASSYAAIASGTYTCSVTNGCGSTTSNSITVNALPNSSFTIVPWFGLTSFCSGSNMLEIQPIISSGDPNYSIQWYLDLQAIPGATFGGYWPTQSGNYSCTITSVCGVQNASYTPTGFNFVSITIIQTPVASITAAGSTTFCPGGGSSVTLNANTGTSLAYQWKLGGANIPGATNSSLLASTAGNYSCVVSNSCGNAISNTIAVIAGALPSAVITAGGSTSICSGGTVTLNANTGAGRSYQWRRDGINISGATASSYAAMLAGNYSCMVTENGCSSTSNSIAVTMNGLMTYFIKPDGTAGKDAYLTNYLSDATTNYGVFPDFDALAWTVNSTPVLVRSLIEFNLNSIPANAVVQSATLSLFNSPISANNNGSHSSLSGSNVGWLQKVTAPWNESTVTWNTQPTTTTLNQVAVPQSTDAHQDYAIEITALIQDMVTNPSSNYGLMIRLQNESYYRALLFAASDHSDPSKWPALSVTYVIPLAAAISTAGLTTACQGDYVMLDANTGAGLSYQWKRNGTDIPGGILSSYPASLPGSYTCVVSDICNNATSNAIAVTIIPPPVAYITSDGSTDICPGANVKLDADTAQDYKYQWQLDGFDIPAETLFTITATLAGDYTCIVSTDCDTVTSNIITVTLLPLPTAVIITFDPTTFCQGNTSKLSANTGGGLSYQWRLNGIDIPGANQPDYDAGASGNYACVVTNSCGSTTSNAIGLSVNTLPAAVITAGGSTTFCPGGSVTLNANTGAGLSYQWKFNGVNISLATASSYLAGAAGNYTCVVTNSCGSTTSNTITITLGALPTATITAGGSTSICPGGSVTLFANTGTGLTHQWKLNGGNIPGATASSYVATATGSYSCAVTNSCGSTTSNAINVTSGTAPTATIAASGSTSICSGGSVTLNANTGAGLTYQWRRNGTNINGATTSSYAATTAGTYTCIVTNSCGSTTSNAINITTSSAPSTPSAINGNNKACPSTSEIYSVSAVSGVTFNWTAPAASSITGGQGTSTVTVTFASNFNGGTISVTASNPCGTSAARTKSISKNNRCTAIAVHNPTPGIERMLDANVYPNPSKDHFTMKIVSDNDSKCLLIIHDLTGREIERRENISPGESIEFGYRLTSGIYLAEVIQGEQRKVMRVVKSQ